MAKIPSFDLLGSLVDQAKATVKLPETPPGNVGEWAAGRYAGGAPIVLDRGPFTFDRHEYLVTPYADDHPRQVERKSTQRGNSTRAMLRMFHAARYLPMVGVLYLFPSKTGIGDFSRSRIAPLVERNPEIIGRHLRDTDSVGLKRFNGVNLLFRGTKSEEGLRSDPADVWRLWPGRFMWAVRRFRRAVFAMRRRGLPDGPLRRPGRSRLLGLRGPSR